MNKLETIADFLKKEKDIKDIASAINKELGVKQPLKNGRSCYIVKATVNGNNYWIQKEDSKFILNGLRQNAYKFQVRTDANSAIATYRERYRYNFEIIPI